MSESVREIIKLFLDKGYLINPDMIEKSGLDADFLNRSLEKNTTGEILVFNENMFDNLFGRSEITTLDKNENLIGEITNESNVRIIKSTNKILSKIKVQDFVMHYQKRYESLKKILQSRSELFSLLSISRILSKKTREEVSTIGLVFEKNYTKNNNLILTIEDNTGSIAVLINKSKKELFDKCRDIVLDEVVGVKGANGERIIFANDIFFPDIPKNNNIKKGNKEEYFAVISDIHIGSKLFLEEDFLNFISWINGEAGNKQQKEIAKKLKYLFIVGDVVDGIGIYPNQEEQQEVKDIKLQYESSAKLLKLIRKDVNIIICPGDHDATRIAEPQPPIDKKMANSLYDLPNIFMVSNPSLINIGSDKEFEGFDVLMYHGRSYSAFANDVESIRFSGDTISDRTNSIMKFLLSKRHLAPTHGSTLFIPDPDTDDLVIDKVPDFFICGHIHKANITQYGQVTKVAGSCWQSRSSFQVKVGHDPTPGRVPLINLKTRETKILKF